MAHKLEQRIDHVTNESVAATQRIREVAEETNQIGVDTLITLNEQGEQLDNVERQLDEINIGLKMVDKNLTQMEKCCGYFTCICCAPKKIQKNKHYKKVYGKKAERRQVVVSDQPKGGPRPPQGPYVKRITDDAKEDEMEDNLQAVSDVLVNLKGIASEMGNELDRQNVQLDNINGEVNKDAIHLDQAITRMQRLTENS